MAKYLVLANISNDKTKKSWPVGATISDGDFSKKVIKNWLEIGVLSEVGKPAEKAEPDSGDAEPPASEIPDGEEVKDNG